MKRVISILTLCSFLISGCSMLRPKHQKIRVNCTPTDATLRINGEPHHAPAEVKVVRNKATYIYVEKDGYAPVNKTIGTNLNFTGKLDLIGTFVFLLPGLGLLAPGTHSLDETKIDITMIRQ